ncbi:MAG TPA: DNA-directed RNA polymerase subunit delta, partial [Chitinophagaceae bacterium]|nr:DNA-directed RNA polymerase subunit delta [Chitinophagaceae bacterium]
PGKSSDEDEEDFKIDEDLGLDLFDDDFDDDDDF